MESKDQQKRKKHTPRMLYKKPGALMLTIAIVILGAILTVSFILPKGQRINNSTYQAVYTTSGVAYFGKLKNTNGEYLVIEQPYTSQQVAAPNQDEDNKEDPTNEGQTTLVKVRDQVYGPEDVISIKSDQVLFWQNLRSDSKVAQAIKNKQ